MDLHIQDIQGAHAGTKGLGPFATKARQTFHNSVTTQDIEGAQAGTIKKGPLSKRMTNPVWPDYPLLGAKEQTRQDNVYAEPIKKEAAVKKVNRDKPEWKKSTVIPIIEDKKVEAKQVAQVDPIAVAATVSLFVDIFIGGS